MLINRLKHIKHVIEVKIELIGRRGERRKQVLDDLQENRRHCEFKEDSLDFTVCELTMEQAVDLSESVLRG